jgi:hypothetical protein
MLSNYKQKKERKNSSASSPSNRYTPNRYTPFFFFLPDEPSQDAVRGRRLDTPLRETVSQLTND